MEIRAVVLEEGENEAIDMRDIRQIIHGDCFVCRHLDGQDGFEPIRDEDVGVIKHLVKKVVRICDSVIEIEK